MPVWHFAVSTHSRNTGAVISLLLIAQALDEEEILNEVDETTFSTASGSSRHTSNPSSNHIEMPTADDVSSRPNSAKSKTSMLTEKSDARERRKVTLSEQGYFYF